MRRRGWPKKFEPCGAALITRPLEPGGSRVIVPRIQFIGKNGRMPGESIDPTATYDIRGDEGHVRARVLESDGRMA